jgi:AcrR family transcriptional regulator
MPVHPEASPDVNGSAHASAVSPAQTNKRSAEILSVAIKVFANRGYRNTDVQEIADIVGIGKGTIYRAFGSKEGLFFAAVDLCMQRLNEVMGCDDPDAIACQSPAQRLESKILTFLRFFEENEELIELLIQERSEFRDRELHSYTRNWLSNSPRWRERLRIAMNAGEYRDLPVDGVIAVLNDVLYGAIFTHYFSKEKVNLESTAKLIADIVLNGILRQPQREG